MSKVACETAAAALPDAAPGAVQLCNRGGAGSSATSPRAAADAGAPPESSVLLRVPDGVGLTHLLFGAGALRRDGSTKGSSNPKAAAEAATRKGAPRSDSRSRSTTTASSSSSSKTAVVIGVLPATASKVVGKQERRRAPAPGRVVVAARVWPRRPAAGARVFASEAAAVGPEPVSPKVSCFGAVLPESSSAAAAPAACAQEEEEEGSGCWAWASLRAALLLGQCRDENSDDLSASGEPTSKAAASPEPQRVAVAVTSPPRPVALAPGLGDVKRLASRRWPEETMARDTV